jgi:hypothetical protein
MKCHYFDFDFRQMLLAILHSGKGWAATALLTSHVRGLLQMSVYMCLLDFISISVFLKHKIAIFTDLSLFFQQHGEGIMWVVL